MSTLSLDALFPDPDDPTPPPTRGSFSSGNPFTLPELYPPSVLGSSCRTRESSIFDVVDLKGFVTYGHVQHVAKKQRLTYRQESIKFGPLGAAASGDSGTGSGSGIGIWRALEGSTLFKIPEDFRRDCGSLGSSALVVDGEGDLGSEVESEDVQSEGESGHDGDNDDDDDELWLDPMVSVPLEKPRYQTWDSFLLRDGNTPQNPYLTEAGSRVFDAALELHQNDPWLIKEAGTVVRGDVFIPCMLHLGLGRSSVLFRYNKKRNAFYPVKEGLRLSGFSVGTVASVVKMFSQCGKHIKGLQRFSERVYKEVSPIPTRVALAECTTTILSALQTRLSIPASSINSIVHLESLFREPALILQTLYRIILSIKGAKDDSKLLSKLFDIVQESQFAGGSSWLRPILMELIRRVSRAWLEVVEQWIGLRGTLGMGLEGEWETRQGFFVKVEWEGEVDERGRERRQLRYIFDKSQVPGFLLSEDAEMVFECGKSLRFLNKFHPGHPLSKPGTVIAQEHTPSLDWKFSWEDLEGIHTQARTYEKALRKAIAKYTESGPSGAGAMSTPLIPGTNIMEHSTPSPDIHNSGGDFTDIFSKSASEIAAILSSSVAIMSAPLPSLDTPEQVNPLYHVTMHTHTISTPTSQSSHLTTFAPPLSISPLLSFSQIFAVQARLVNAACLRMFFVEHNLREHFTLLYRFLLLGDSVFTSRVSNALFSDDEDIDTTERREGGYRSGGRMGLHVASRDSWPPASSELRLALAGLLNEAYHGPQQQHVQGGADTSTDPYSRASSDLPGALSFAIRDLSPGEFESVMDPHKLSALDFLRINYSPPEPLGEVLTGMAMYKYDRVFRFLLRLVRMRFAVDQVWRDGCRRGGGRGRGSMEMLEMKFRIASRHFVVAVAGYIWEIALGATWRGWEGRLDMIERALEREAGGGSREGDDGVGAGTLSLAHITSAHSSVLDRIMFLMFLRRRQTPVMGLLEEVFGLVLRFARHIAERGKHGRGGGGMLNEEELTELYYLFRKRVKTFCDVVRSLSEKRGYGDARVAVGEEAGGGKIDGGQGAATAVGSGEGAVFQTLLVRLEFSGE